MLDHGYVTLRNISGPTRRPNSDFDAHDVDPSDSARISFDQMGAGGRTYEDEMKLAGYLIKNRHNTPLEMIEVWLEMKLPIFVARQFVRHRTACINEVSARYKALPAEWYIPETVGAKAPNAKQGQVNTLCLSAQEEFKASLNESCRESHMKYESFMLSGVAPEHARMFLHVNHYTHWLWKQDLSNLMHFLSLRADSHAQIEARKYAEAIIILLSDRIPGLMELFEEHRRA